MRDKYIATLDFALHKDREDMLKSFRSRFHFPLHPSNPAARAIYFCGNSLGLQPSSVAGLVAQELKDWQDLGVSGYSHAKNPWLVYQDAMRPSLAAIVGANIEEVTVMNALTVNLHLLLLSFYRPDKKRYRIIMEAGAFPSDQYALETQARWHGFDPDDAIIEITPRAGEKLLRDEDILDTIDRHKDSLALVLLGGINYYTGQYYDIPAITEAAHRAGAIAGFDLAHVVGNIPTRLHDWNVDFAVWCSYKYLNGGPGAVGCAYIHERYARNRDHSRLGGWWGNEESTRFKMEKGFIPKANASGWNLSTAQVFNMVSLRASLPYFDEAGMDNLRAKSLDLTAWLEFLLAQLRNLSFEIITPSGPHRRGAQLSLYFKEKGKEIHQRMIDSGIIVDYREPGVIRVAPAPLYNSFEDVYRFYDILQQFQ